METVEVLKKVKKEISDIKLTSWDYDNNLYEFNGETIRNKAVEIVDKYLSETIIEADKESEDKR